MPFEERPFEATSAEAAAAAGRGEPSRCRIEELGYTEGGGQHRRPAGCRSSAESSWPAGGGAFQSQEGCGRR